MNIHSMTASAAQRPIEPMLRKVKPEPSVAPPTTPKHAPAMAARDSVVPSPALPSPRLNAGELPKLRAATSQFEATWLRDMMARGSRIDPSAKESPTASFAREQRDMAISDAVARAGGFGLGTAIYARVAKSFAHPTAAAAGATPHVDQKS